MCLLRTIFHRTTPIPPNRRSWLASIITGFVPTTQELLFRRFDADGDDHLDRGEYRAYLEAIGFWAQAGWTQEAYKAEKWAAQCAALAGDVATGIPRSGFAKLYREYRTNQMAADFAAAFPAGDPQDETPLAVAASGAMPPRPVCSTAPRPR